MEIGLGCRDVCVDVSIGFVRVDCEGIVKMRTIEIGSLVTVKQMGMFAVIVE